MNEITMNVNWLAVVVGFFLAFALGWLWYSPMLFGKKWADGVGISLDDSPGGPPVAAMIVQAVGTFLLAWTVGLTAASNALTTLILIVLTIVFLSAGGGLFTGKKASAIAIEVSFVIAMATIMVVCHGIL
jgi:hypothetical protein